MKKKTTSLLLAGSLFVSAQINVFSQPAIADSESYKLASADVANLVDVSPNHWSYDSLKYVVQELDIMDPLTPTRFGGNELATRYTVATAFHRAIKKT